MSHDATVAHPTPKTTIDAIDAMVSYRAPEASRLTKFLWWCAGADEQLLKFCTTSEHIRYQGVGAFVLFTGLLAFLSGGYAIFTVFRPLDPAASAVGPAIGGLAFGAFWATIIFNLDRYIVSSTGKGDGKETISLSELINSLPRLVMAGLIGVVMSVPIELRLFEREINVELKRKEIDTMADYERRDSIAFSARTHTLDSLTTSLEHQGDTAAMLTRQAYDAMSAEGDGTGGTGRNGTGKRWEAKKTRFEQLTTDETRLRAALKPARDSLQREQRSLRDSLAAHRVDNLKTARQIGGLIDRLRIADDKGGMSIWVLRFLLLVLETIPVLTKLMHRTGPYDILCDHLKVLIPARLGITTETRTGVMAGKLVSRVTDSHPVADFVLKGAEMEVARRLPAAEPTGDAS